MIILTFDTCFNKTYVVLRNDSLIKEYKTIENTNSNYHSVFLIPAIKDILIKNNILIKDIDAIGVNIGPGSFTGIRAGITVARVLCQQFNIKLAGIPSLNILSGINNYSASVVLDARKNKVYFANYDKGNEIIAPCLIEKDELLKKLNGETVITDKSIFDFLTDKYSNVINFEENDKDIGIYLSNLVSQKLNEQKEDFNWAKVKPLYIQPPSITKPKEKTNV